jgi:hypothetical protein
MKRWLKAPSPALVISLVALFVALGGTTYAATSLPKNSVGTVQLKKGAVTKKKINKKTIAALRGNRGPRGPQGAKGATGATGATGNTGAAGPSGVVDVKSWAGFDTGVSAHSTAFTFDGPTTTVTTTSTQRLTASATIDLETSAGTALLDVAICIEPSSGAYLTELGSGLYRSVTASTTSVPISTAQSGTPGADTWTIGVCVFNQSATQAVNANGDSTGYAFVTN